MYYVAAALLGLSGLFYSAGRHELGSFGADVCSYGGTFCDSPAIVFTDDQPATLSRTPRGMAIVTLAQMPRRLVRAGGTE